MIVFCEECGERNIVDPNVIQTQKVRCRACNDVLRIYTPQAQTNNASAALSSGVDSKTSNPKMELRYHDRILEVSKAQPVITIGRQEHNDLEVIDTRVSRSHARIEYRNGQFILVDQSTNGTYVFTLEKQGVNIRKTEFMLLGSGVIGLGRKVDFDSPEAVHFSIKN